MKFGILAITLAAVPALAQIGDENLSTQEQSTPSESKYVKRMPGMRNLYSQYTRDEKSEQKDHLRKVTARSVSPHESTDSAIDWAGAEMRDLVAKGPPPGICNLNCIYGRVQQCKSIQNLDLTTMECSPERIEADCMRVCPPY